MAMNSLRLWLALLGMAMLLAPRPAMAWWDMGHTTVARIAQANVAPGTRAAIAALLRHAPELATPGCPVNTMASASVWPDCIKALGDRFSYQYSWHYQNISICQPYDVKAACPDGNCVTAQIDRNARLLKDRKLPARERLMALAFLIHFVGDLHQPLHNEDVARGGNGILVRWGGRELNLHHVWDSSILEKWLGGLRGKPYPLAKRWATQLTEEISHGKWAEEKESWIKDINLADTNSTALAWSREANALVCSHGESHNGSESVLTAALKRDKFFHKALRPSKTRS